MVPRVITSEWSTNLVEQSFIEMEVVSKLEITPGGACIT